MVIYHQFFNSVKDLATNIIIQLLCGHNIIPRIRNETFYVISASITKDLVCSRRILSSQFNQTLNGFLFSNSKRYSRISNQIKLLITCEENSNLVLSPVCHNCTQSIISANRFRPSFVFDAHRFLVISQLFNFLA